MFRIEWSDVVEIVLVMERFPIYIVVALGWGECRSWNWVMVSSKDFDGMDGWCLWGFYKLEVSIGKINQLGIGILLLSNELGHSLPINSSKKIMSNLIL
jgi:hypothetical protein